MKKRRFTNIFFFNRFYQVLFSILETKATTSYSPPIHQCTSQLNRNKKSSGSLKKAQREV